MAFLTAGLCTIYGSTSETFLASGGLLAEGSLQKLLCSATEGGCGAEFVDEEF